MALTSEEEHLRKLRSELHQSVGECVLAWSQVEFHLAFLFRAVMNTHPAVSDAALAAVRSFEARLKMIGDAFNARFTAPDSEFRTDWHLLYKHCSSLNALRNQVAHATELLENGTKPVIEPFMVFSAPKAQIERAEIQARATRFLELAGSVAWLEREINGTPKPPKALQLPIPDLVLQLRAEAAQRRAKHGRPPRS